VEEENQASVSIRWNRNVYLLSSLFLLLFSAHMLQFDGYFSSKLGYPDAPRLCSVWRLDAVLTAKQ